MVEYTNNKNGDEPDQSGTIICSNHPFSQTNNNQSPAAAGGGICGLCLQEKLDNLVSSSFPITTFPTSSSSSSFRSDLASTPFNHHHHVHGDFPSSRAKIFPFLTINQKKKKKMASTMEDEMLCFSDPTKKFNLKRSKSSVVGRRNEFMGNEDLAPARKGFWSYFHSSKSIKSSSPETSPEKKQNGFRKVSRSRSVGCGSRSFSGDFFERISTGLGDCTLRRVESQREAKTKPPISGAGDTESRVKCGGKMFRGFSMTASPEQQPTGTPATEQRLIPAECSRSKKWGWVLASPIRAFGTKHGAKSSKNVVVAKPDLNGLPSLLSVKT